MTGGRPSLGVFGPYHGDRSGVANYIHSSIPYLDQHYAVTVVSNNSEWVDPRAFDVTLYHLGNNSMHHCAFEAARLRPGVSLLHEYLCLDYYYQCWDLVDRDRRTEILARLTSVTNIAANSLEDFLVGCSQNSVDPYAIDVHVEKYIIADSVVSATHSSEVTGFLTKRYPGEAVRSIPFPVERWLVADRSGALERYGIQRGSFTFASFGFIGEYKRVPWLIDAWRSWRNRPRDAKLLLVGERQIDIDTTGDGIVETGYVSDEEFVQLIASIDCGVQLRSPSLGETSAPAAALTAHGRPAILSDIPEMRALRGGTRTILVKSDNDVIDNLSDAMLTQYRLGREPYRAFDSRYSWEAWQASIMALLTD